MVNNVIHRHSNGGVGKEYLLELFYFFERKSSSLLGDFQTHLIDVIFRSVLSLVMASPSANSFVQLYNLAASGKSFCIMTALRFSS